MKKSNLFSSTNGIAKATDYKESGTKYFHNNSPTCFPLCIDHTLSLSLFSPTSPLNITFYIEICTNSVNQPAGQEIGGLTMILGVEPHRLTGTDSVCKGRNIFLSVK